MLVATREGERRCRLPPHQRALVVALVYLRKDDTVAHVAAAFGISAGTATNRQNGRCSRGIPSE